MAARVSIKDVAALAGVSWKTVSNVVHDYEHVSERMRAKVQAAIDELIVARGTTSDKLTLARIEARITQLERAKKDLDSLKG